MVRHGRGRSALICFEAHPSFGEEEEERERARPGAKQQHRSSGGLPGIFAALGLELSSALDSLPLHPHTGFSRPGPFPPCAQPVTRSEGSLCLQFCSSWGLSSGPAPLD